MITYDRYQSNLTGFANHANIPINTIYSCPNTPKQEILMVPDAQESYENLSFSRMRDEESLPCVRRSAAPTIPHHEFLQQLKDQMRSSCSPDMRRESGKMLQIQAISPDRDSERDLLNVTGNTGSAMRNRESMLSIRPILMAENSEISNGFHQLIKGNRQSISDSNHTNGTTTVGSFVGAANSDNESHHNPQQNWTPVKQPT